MMNIEAEKIAITKLLLDTKDINILNEVKAILNKNTTTDFWDELSEEQKEEINIGTEQLNNGEYISYESLLKSIVND